MSAENFLPPIFSPNNDLFLNGSGEVERGSDDAGVVCVGEGMVWAGEGECEVLRVGERLVCVVVCVGGGGCVIFVD